MREWVGLFDESRLFTFGCLQLMQVRSSGKILGHRELEVHTCTRGYKLAKTYTQGHFWLLCMLLYHTRCVAKLSE